ncbi:lysis system i-spanin subunit Rz [Pseudomonas lundensis]|uniref:lysis system i-spanin subunit Rz n=1 Tax=Pseudomonas lundensis TaxID=86185 RepID=UPI0030BA2584
MKLDAVKWGGALLVMLGLMFGSAWTAWTWQANAYGQQLAAKETAYQTERTNLANANSALILAEQGKRLALEQWLAASDQAHYRALTDAKTTQTRLRDRLATVDLRLSVLLDATPATGSDAMQTATATGTSSMVHGTARAQLNPAHARRIIGITGDGDQGLIALQACQAYAKEVSRTK